ncbi:calcium-binding protein [Nocardioides sp. YIM 152588]|uniref:calcium-binding protein n=1 Tax=Nocardioides sp. YIM 152588 TaxID=3158259 RepID=UPI0032E384A9
MSRKLGALLSASAVLVAAVSAAVTVPATANPGYHYDEPPGGRFSAGPPYRFVTSLTGSHEPMRDGASRVLRTEHGYRFVSGGQHNRVKITETSAGVRIADARTKRFKKLPAACEKAKARRGSAAVCKIPGDVTAAQPLLVEVWPRLGNDHVDGSSLSSRFALTVLGDRGRELVRFGAGPDFFNGFRGADRVYGGAGNDWLRSGVGNDVVVAGPGDDQIMDLGGSDRLFGGTGDDRINGKGPGKDVIKGGPGDDITR